MGSFSTINKAPGVYIQEITLPGPIPGVSTSITAFVGPAQSGPLLQPTMLTQMSQFTQIFGSYIEVPYRVYATHAVNGFFAEGGQQCYFVRVGNGKQAWLNLLDQGNLVVTTNPQQTTLVVRAQDEGAAGDSITAKVDAASIVSTPTNVVDSQTTVAVAQTTVTIANTTLTQASAANSVQVQSVSGFNVGDTVNLAQPAPATTNENAVIANISGKTITFQANLTNSYPTASTVTYVPAAKIVNVQSASGFSVGDTVSVAQPTPSTTKETAVIASINGSSITFQANLANSYPASSTVTYVPTAWATRVMVQSASGFQPGDTINLNLPSPSTTNENAVIASISGTIFNLQSPLTNAYAAGSAVRTADLAGGLQQIRVASVAGFAPGSYVHISISDSSAPDSYDVVRVVNPVSNILTLTNGLTSAYSMANSAVKVTVASMEFTLTVVSTAAGTEIFKNLAMDPRHSRYFGTIVNSNAVTVTIANPPSTTPPPLNLPATIGATSLGGGADDNLNTLTTTDYHNGIDALKKCSDVNLLCVPDCVTTSPSANSHFQTADTHDIQAYMIAHCELMQDRFAILDPNQYVQSDVTYNAIKGQRQSLNSNNGYGAIHFPWVGISSPFSSGQIFVPPSGHIAGVYAKNDSVFGVWEAPANEPILSALSLDTTLNDGEQGPLNEQGIDVIRTFPNSGILIWGARTIAPPDQTAWRYINVRRLLLYIEKSIQEGTRFAVFEPNNLSLWQQVKRLVTDFLTPLWQEGALFGATAAQAFRVIADATLNTPEVTALGQLIVQVTVVPTHPAEFIIFQVIQDPTGASLQESTAA